MVPALGTSADALSLCGQCRRETLPGIKAPSYLNDMWRAPSKGMEQPKQPIDAAAEKVKASKERRKAKKQSFRAVLKSEGIVAATKLFLAGRAEGFVPLPDDAECPRCLKRSRENAQRIARGPRRGNYGMMKAIVLVHRDDVETKRQSLALDPKDTRQELNFDNR